METEILEKQNGIIHDEVIYANPVTRRDDSQSLVAPENNNKDVAYGKPPVYAKPTITVKPHINMTDRKQPTSGPTVSEDTERVTADIKKPGFLKCEDENCYLNNKTASKPPIYAKPVFVQNALVDDQKTQEKNKHSGDDNKTTSAEKSLVSDIISESMHASSTNADLQYINNTEALSMQRTVDFNVERFGLSSEHDNMNSSKKPLLYPRPFQAKERTSNIKPPLYAKPKLVLNSNCNESADIVYTHHSSEKTGNVMESNKVENDVPFSYPLMKESKTSQAHQIEVPEEVKEHLEADDGNGIDEPYQSFCVNKNSTKFDVEILSSVELSSQVDKIDEIGANQIEGQDLDSAINRIRSNIECASLLECSTGDASVALPLTATAYEAKECSKNGNKQNAIQKAGTDSNALDFLDCTETTTKQNEKLSEKPEQGKSVLPPQVAITVGQNEPSLEKSIESSLNDTNSCTFKRQKVPKPTRPPPPPSRQKKVVSQNENVGCRNENVGCENVTLDHADKKRTFGKEIAKDTYSDKRKLPEIPLRTKRKDATQEMSEVCSVESPTKSEVLKFSDKTQRIDGYFYKNDHIKNLYNSKDMQDTDDARTCTSINNPVTNEEKVNFARKLTKNTKDKPDGFKIPFTRRRSKIDRKVMKVERKSCPLPDTTTEDIIAQIHETVEDKWKCKSFSSAKEKADNSAEEELLYRLQEQRKKTEANRENSPCMKNTLVNEIIKEDEELENADLFDHVLVVKLRHGNNGLEPYISFRFPPKQKFEEEIDPRVASIPQFCFPDLKSGMSEQDYKEKRAGYKTNETFSFVLTDMIGQRHFGYCRQIQMNVERKTIHASQLPEVYCIVSPYGLFGLYSQILDEVEKQCKFSSTSVFSFLKAVLSHSLPRPGHSVEISFFSGGSQGIKSVTLQRAGDSAIHEHVDFQLLFDSISIHMILRVVSALLLERRIILASSQLSLLSACCHAFISLLYPFQWQHTYIPVLPHQLLDMCCLPTPYLLGALSGSLEDLEELPLDEVIIIDLDDDCVLRDDEGEDRSNFPSHIRNTIETSLSSVLKKDAHEGIISGSKERNMIITEIFIDGYLSLIGNFQEFYSDKADDGSGFESVSFSKSSKSKEQRKFLKQFVKTQAFQFFIRQYNIENAYCKGLFEERLQEWKISKKHKSNESGWHRVFGKFKVLHR